MLHGHMALPIPTFIPRILSIGSNIELVAGNPSVLNVLIELVGTLSW